MVKVLPDHFPQITLAIICIAWSVGHKIYYRNFLPSQQTKLITGIQESIILWIMGDTDIIAAHFLQQTDVATVRGYTFYYMLLLNHLDSLFPSSSINHDFLEDDGWVVRSEGEGVDAIG